MSIIDEFMKGLEENRIDIVENNNEKSYSTPIFAKKALLEELKDNPNSIKAGSFKPYPLDKLPDFRYMSYYKNDYYAYNPRAIREYDGILYVCGYRGIIKIDDNLNIIDVVSTTPSADVVFKDNIMFVLTWYQQIKAFDLNTGGLIWEFGEYNVKGNTYDGKLYNPNQIQVVNNVLFVSTQDGKVKDSQAYARGGITAIDANTGTYIDGVYEGDTERISRLDYKNGFLYALAFESDKIKVFNVFGSDLNVYTEIKKPENTGFGDLNIGCFYIVDVNNIWVYSDVLKKIINIDKNGDIKNSIGKYGFENFSWANIRPSTIAYLYSFIVKDDRIIGTDSTNHNIKIYYKTNKKKIRYNIPGKVIVSEIPIDENNIALIEVDEDEKEIKVAYK